MKKLSNLVTCAAVAMFTADAHAIESAGIPAGGFTFIPSLGLALAYDDNIRATRNRESSWITTITPDFLLMADQGNSVYRLSYGLSHDVYHSSPGDSNTDHFANASADMEFDARNRLKLAVDYRKTTDVDSDRSTLGKEEFTRVGAMGLYTYGAKNALFNLDVGLSHRGDASDNNLNLDKEYDSNRVTGTLYVRVSPKTQLLAEARNTFYHYRSAPLDSENLSFLAGMRWEASAFTSGSVKVGTTNKSYREKGLADKTTSKWEAGVVWQPLAYTQFDLNTRRGIDEGNAGSRLVVNLTNSVGWRHDWSPLVKSDIKYSQRRDEYSNDRVDEVANTGIGVTFAVRRWVDVSVGYQHSHSKSTISDKNFKRDVYMLKLNMGL